MGPVFLIALLVFRRRVWRERWFYFGIAALVVIISPVVIYNVMVWRTRGYLDAALSTLVGQHPDDYYILAREVRTSAAGIRTAFYEVRSQMSAGVQLIVAASLAWFGYANVRNRFRGLNAFFLAGIAFALLMLVAVGGDVRFSVVLIPFLVLAFALGGSWSWERLRGNLRSAFLVIVAVIAGWEAVFAAETQLTPIPPINYPLLHATRQTTFWHGYNALDSYIRDFYRQYPNPNYYLLAQEPQIRAYKERVIAVRAARQLEAPQQTQMLIYDDRIDWFASVWLIERRRLYEGAFIPSLTNFMQAVNEGYLEKFREFGFTDATFVISTDRITRETVENRSQIEQFAADLAAQATPSGEIKNVKGETVFIIYKLPLDVAYFAGFAR
jgi:hypothetical protein